MAKWALGFASVGDTYLVNFDEEQVYTLEAPTKGKKKKKIPVEQVPVEVQEPDLEIPDERIRFVDEMLEPGDHLYTEMGGPSGPLLFRAFDKGVLVFRIPVIDLPSFEDSSESDEEELESEQETFDSNRDRLRRDRTLAIAEFAKEHPERFYPMRISDAEVAALSVMTRNFDNWQRRIRIKGQTQIMQINRDLAFYPDQGSRALARLRKQFGEEELLAETAKVEGQMERFIASTLEGMELYQKVFAPISGCGVITAARIIDVVQDIRRFSKKAKFRRYSGWFPAGEDGQIVRRRRGELMRYSTKLKQAAHLYGMQVAQYGRGDEIREDYILTKEREAAKEGVTKAHANRRATRRAIGKFLDKIFREWWRFEVTAGTMNTLHVPVEEIPPGVAQSLAEWYPDLGVQMASQGGLTK